jgi:hypothetical protein
MWDMNLSVGSGFRGSRVHGSVLGAGFGSSSRFQWFVSRL